MNRISHPHREIDDITVYFHQSMFRINSSEGSLMQNKRIVSIDIIKGIAMIMVILYHYQQTIDVCKWFYYLRMGCPIFFVASGFAIMCLINNRYSGELDKKNVGKFYFSRFKALAPGWYLTIIIVYLVNTITLAVFKKTLNFGTNRSLISILCNFLFLNGLLPFCNNDVTAGGWYVGATALLYLLTPFILWANRIFRSRRLFFVISSVLVVAIWAVLYIRFNLIGYFSFAFHYPEYLLGVMLYFDLSESVLNYKQIKACLPLGLIVFACAYCIFYIDFSLNYYLSAWMTGLATYLVLYYMISNEANRNKNNLLRKVLASFGENSYCIFLLHAFYAWTLIQAVNIIAKRFGIDIHNYFCLFAFMPIVLALSYYSGAVMRNCVRKITKNLFKKA